MTEDILQRLKKGKEILSDESRWCQGWYAQTAAGGYGVEPHSPSARRFCATGCPAVHECNGALGYLNKAAWLLYKTNTVIVNDEIGHTAVMKVYDKAIALCEEDIKNTLGDEKE